MNLLGGQMAAPAAAVDRELEQVLLALADGSYVLSTPDGSVAESGTGVVGLLGTSAERLVGQPIGDVLIAGADDAARNEFDRLLRAPAIDPSARPTFASRCAEDATRSLQFVVVCVPLALGWEFTSLLSELRSRDAGTWHPEELRLRHGRALGAVEGVVRHGTQPDPTARLAGILIVVRDVDAPPLTHDDVDRRMAEQRAAARAAAAEAARRTDEAAGRGASTASEAGAQAPGLEDLVERARVLRERVEDAERDAAAALLERDEARARLEGLGGELDAARRDAESARAEAQAAHADAEGLRAELASACAELTAARAENALARGEAAAVRAQLEAARSDLAARDAELETRTSQLHDLDAELETTRAQLERTQAELETTLSAAENVRVEREQARARAQQLMDEAEQARAAADAIRAEFAFEPVENGDGRQPPPAQRTAWSAPAAGAAAPAACAQSDAAKPELPAVAPGEAAALIALDGSFKRLDEAFCSLLGCREEDLRAARWPSIIDRENLAAHQEVARALKAGEIQSAEIDTVYMHAQGLLVPIAGTVSLHRPPGCEPHFLFRADVSRTAGVPGVS